MKISKFITMNFLSGCRVNIKYLSLVGIIMLFSSFTVFAGNETRLKILCLNNEYTFNLQELEKLNSTEYKTKDPWLGTRIYKGVNLETIVKYFKCKAVSLTLVNNEKQKLNIDIENVNKYPILLAYNEGGEEIPYCQGGALKLVFPYNSHPEIKKVFPPKDWMWRISEIKINKK